MKHICQNEKPNTNRFEMSPELKVTFWLEYHSVVVFTQSLAEAG